MADQLVALIVDESKWLTASSSIALLAAATLLFRHRHSLLPTRRRTLGAMNLFFGVTIGAMACGHLLAVTTKLALGTLQGSVLVFYLIGIGLAVPSWWLIYHTRAVLSPDDTHGWTTLILNGWAAFTLLALGVHNLPLAAPGILNIGYHLHSRRWVGRAMLTVAVIINGGLFVGSLLFLASGQSFEQFRGLK